MAILSTGVLLVFVAAFLVSFVVPFVKEGVAKQLSWCLTFWDLKRFSALLLPFVLLMAVGQYFDLVAANSLSYFVAGALVPFLITRLGFPCRFVAMLLLVLGVLVTMLLTPESASGSLMLLIAGLVFWKLSENVVFQGTSSLEDVLPCLVWLGGVYWINVASPESQIIARQGLLLGFLGLALFIRLIQGWLLAADKWYLKRIALAVSGGLLGLIFLTKVLLVPQWDWFAVFVGGGIFLAYLLEAIEPAEGANRGASQATMQLILIGVLTLVASRLIGTFGWLMLAAMMLVATRAGVATLAGLFLVVRVILQGFVMEYSPNVSGINITHPYVSAALYAGMLLAIVLSVFFRDMKQQKLPLVLALFAALLLAPLSNYFIHAEPTASLLVSTVVASLMLALFGPVLYQKQVPAHENLLLVPAGMIALASLSHQLIPIGNVASSTDRLMLLVYLLGAVLICSVVARWVAPRLGIELVKVP